MARRRQPTLNDDWARALGSALIVLSWSAIWKLAQGGRQTATPIDSKRIEELIANAVSKHPAPTRTVAAYVGKGDRWAKRGALVAGVALLIVLASTSIRVSPTEARWFGIVGLTGLMAAAVFIRGMTRRAVASARRIPGSHVPDMEAMEQMLHLIDMEKPMPLTERSQLYNGIQALREAEPWRRKRARENMTKQVTKILGQNRALRALQALRTTGPALIALGFVAAWMLVFLLVWSIDTSAFAGVSGHADLSQFLYLALSQAVGRPTNGVDARSRFAEALVAAELATAALLLAVYATALVRVAPSEER